MAAHAINRTCVGCCPLSIHKNTNTSCDSNSRNSSVTSLHHHNDDNDDDLKCLIQLYRSIPDYRDVNHLSELEFYDTLQLLKETSKELRTPTKVHAATCHSHFGLPTFCPAKKLKSRKKKSRKSILASSLSVLPSKNCHEIHKSQVKDMKFLKPNSIKELKEAKVNEMKESNDAILINDVHNTIANKQNEICAKNFLQESVSVTPASTTSKTLERFTDRRKDDITNDNNNTTPESKKCLRKDVISPKDSSQSIQNIIKSKEHKTTKIQNRLKDTSISSVHLATRPNLAATLRLECGKKKIKELTKDFHYPDRTGTSSSLFDWEIRKSPSWKALSSNESHKKLLAVKLATRKAEQALLKHEYELNMEIMRQRVKSAPLLFERTNYWTTNVGKIKHNCQKVYNGHQVCLSCHHEDHHFLNGNSCSSRKSNNKCRCSHFVKLIETDLDKQLNSIQLSEHKRKNSAKKNVLNNYSHNDKICSLPSKCQYHHHKDTSNCKRKSKSNRKKILQVSPQSMTTTNVNDSGDDLCSLDKAYL